MAVAAAPLAERIATLAVRLVDGELKLEGIGQDDLRWRGWYAGWIEMLHEYEDLCTPRPPASQGARG